MTRLSDPTIARRFCASLPLALVPAAMLCLTTTAEAQIEPPTDVLAAEEARIAAVARASRAFAASTSNVWYRWYRLPYRTVIWKFMTPGI